MPSSGTSALWAALSVSCSHIHTLLLNGTRGKTGKSVQNKPIMSFFLDKQMQNFIFLTGFLEDGSFFFLLTVLWSTINYKHLNNNSTGSDINLSKAY